MLTVQHYLFIPVTQGGRPAGRTWVWLLSPGCPGGNSSREQPSTRPGRPDTRCPSSFPVPTRTLGRGGERDTWSEGTLSGSVPCCLALSTICGDLPSISLPLQTGLREGSQAQLVPSSIPAPVSHTRQVLTESFLNV